MLDPAKAGQVVKNPAKCAGQAVHGAKVALEGVGGSGLIPGSTSPWKRVQLVYLHHAMTNGQILTLSAALVATSMHAQTTFAPTGAKWTYKQAHWGGPDTALMVIEVTGDTLIEGRICKKLQINEGWFGCHQLAQFLSESQDSLFYFGSSTGQHHLVFRWNAAIGDVWSTPVVQIGQQDTLDWTVLDTSLIWVDGLSLRSLEVSVESRQWSSFGFGGTVTERLGNLIAPFAWLYGVCDGEVFAGLRCYEDTDITWQNPLVAQCTLGVGIGEREEAGSWIRPSLASRGEPVFITGVEGSMTVFDATGRQLSAQTVRGEQVITFDRPGAYVLQFSSGRGEWFVERVMVR